MNYEFNTNLLKEDWQAVKDFTQKFVKSFGASPKKFSFKEEMDIKFHLWLVDLGPAKIIKAVFATVIFIILFFTVFIHSDYMMQIIWIFIFIMAYFWIFGTELAAEAKSGKTAMDHFIHIIGTEVSSWFKKPDAKKK